MPFLEEAEAEALHHPVVVFAFCGCVLFVLFVFLCSLPTSRDAPCPALKSNWAAIIVRIGDRMHALRMHFGTEDFGIFIWNNQVIWCTKKQDKPKILTPQHQDIWGRAAGFGFSVTLSDFVAPYLMGQYQPLAGMSCRRPDHEEILCDCDLVVGLVVKDCPLPILFSGSSTVHISTSPYPLLEHILHKFSTCSFNCSILEALMISEFPTILSST